MPFTAGLVRPTPSSNHQSANLPQVSGLTLTTGVLYLSLLGAQRDRIRQSTLLNQQSLILNSIVDPSIVPIEDAPRFMTVRANWTETWKDRWNAEVEGVAKWVLGGGWERVGSGIRGRWREWTEGKRRA